MHKTLIRKIFLDKRNQLSPDEFTSSTLSLLGQLKSEPAFCAKQNYHIFLPIGSKKELDTWPIIEYLWSCNKNVYVPITDFETNQLHMAPLQKETELKLNKWGIPEPAHPVENDNIKLDIVFVPLLAFDKTGNRVGYGKGFYDQFLSSLPYAVIKIGLSLFEPIDRVTDSNAMDIRMDYCITPNQIYRF